jgi:7-cyano-7-deazaguanine reductase
MNRIPLGKKIPLPKGHDPSVLYPIPRKPYNYKLYGYDLWRSYELSWLNSKGKPRIGILEIVYPVESKCIVESKSLKLYLGGLSFERFDSAKGVEEIIRQDIEHILSTEWISVRIIEQAGFPGMTCRSHLAGTCLDNRDIQITTFQRDPALLSCSQGLSEEELYSDLLKTNCPITGQPDWGSVAICYRGRTIDHEALLKYICSYRDHEGFAEEVCEQIFLDIMERCKPDKLTVRCFYTRRGGIDINPLRSTHPNGTDDIDRARLIRQ